MKTFALALFGFTVVAAPAFAAVDVSNQPEAEQLEALIFGKDNINKKLSLELDGKTDMEKDCKVQIDSSERGGVGIGVWQLGGTGYGFDVSLSAKKTRHLDLSIKPNEVAGSAVDLNADDHGNYAYKETLQLKYSFDGIKKTADVESVTITTNEVDDWGNAPEPPDSAFKPQNQHSITCVVTK